MRRFLDMRISSLNRLICTGKFMLDSLKAKFKLLKSPEVDQKGCVQAFDILLHMRQRDLNPFQSVFGGMAIGVVVRHLRVSA